MGISHRRPVICPARFNRALPSFPRVDGFHESCFPSRQILILCPFGIPYHLRTRAVGRHEPVVTHGAHNGVNPSRRVCLLRLSSAFQAPLHDERAATISGPASRHVCSV